MDPREQLILLIHLVIYLLSMLPMVNTFARGEQPARVADPSTAITGISDMYRELGNQHVWHKDFQCQYGDSLKGFGKFMGEYRAGLLPNVTAEAAEGLKNDYRVRIRAAIKKFQEAQERRSQLGASREQPPTELRNMTADGRVISLAPQDSAAPEVELDSIYKSMVDVCKIKLDFNTYFPRIVNEMDDIARDFLNMNPGFERTESWGRLFRARRSFFRATGLKPRKSVFKDDGGVEPNNVSAEPRTAEQMLAEATDVFEASKELHARWIDLDGAAFYGVRGHLDKFGYNLMINNFDHADSASRAEMVRRMAAFADNVIEGRTGMCRTRRNWPSPTLEQMKAGDIPQLSVPEQLNYLAMSYEDVTEFYHWSLLFDEMFIAFFEKFNKAGSDFLENNCPNIDGATRDRIDANRQWMKDAIGSIPENLDHPRAGTKWLRDSDAVRSMRETIRRKLAGKSKNRRHLADGVSEEAVFEDELLEETTDASPTADTLPTEYSGADDASIFPEALAIIGAGSLMVVAGVTLGYTIATIRARSRGSYDMVPPANV